jgi:hypothetical protein
MKQHENEFITQECTVVMVTDADRTVTNGNNNGVTPSLQMTGTDGTFQAHVTEQQRAAA